MNIEQVKRVIEGLLLSSVEPLCLEDMTKVFAAKELPLKAEELSGIIKDLAYDYTSNGSSLELIEVAGGYRLQVASDLSEWIGKLREEKPMRYSRAFLETLALIAYKQPITRAEIEDVRGVAVSSNTVRTLLEHEWIKVVGHKEVPGRPALFATTDKFLAHFKLKKLDELPPLCELIDFAQADVDVQLGFMGTELPQLDIETEDKNDRDAS